MKFRMVDRIVDYERCKSIRAAKTVSFEEYQLKSPFGDRPSLPESLILESLFQSGLWLIMLSSDFTKMGLLVRVQEVRFIEPVSPGQTIFIEVRARTYRDDEVLFDGQARVDQKTVAYGKGCLVRIVQLAEYFAPDDLKVLFSEIYRPDEHNKA
jgi:3-hydroxyacyl-[acyl-carrier-protein] dehydratase